MKSTKEEIQAIKTLLKDSRTVNIINAFKSFYSKIETRTGQIDQDSQIDF
ncbi:hypothetical protein [Streptococcus pneumoniae]|nr:hypothetical protein [Streptococcus pneumoniae]